MPHPNYTPEELKEILRLHWLWHDKKEGGKKADLSGADLRKAVFRKAFLVGIDFKGADLSGADLRGSYLHGADLSGADLSKSYLRGANLSGATVTRNGYFGRPALKRARLRGLKSWTPDEGDDYHEAIINMASLRVIKR